MQTNTHTLRAAEAVASLLARWVTNELEHIVLALGMSRGVKMSPQIATGHQMSPFYSTLPTQFLDPFFLIHLFFYFHLLTIFTIHSALFLFLSSASTLSPFDTTFLFISSKGQRGEENRVKESEFS